MKQNNKKPIITLVVLSTILFAFIIFGLIFTKIESNELKKNPEYSIAVIVDTYVGAKARDYVKYKFLANGKAYIGNQHYMPHKQIVNIGDSCEVVYAWTNPNISRLLTNSDDLLKIK
ncbi:MAG: hypothetical protein PHS05_13060 [Bacteroidales bacterium]|jgi:hypothetical protein|nr:hypothetical protein [Bacteroidales bacterium]